MLSMLTTRSAKRWVAGAITVAAAIFLWTGATPVAAGSDQAKAKRYKATRPFVVDKQTGEVRMPTQEEVDEVVATLTALGQRDGEGLTQSTQATGAVTVELDGSNSGIVLARPNGDGTFETRCVFTVEEGAAFLGLVVDESVR
jgi:hypothetical protein